MSGLEKVDKLFKALSKEDVDFYGTTDKSVKKAINATKKRLVSNLNKMILKLDKNNDIVEIIGDESIFDSWNSIANTLDSAFERSDKIFDIEKRKSNKRKHANGDEYTIGNGYQYLEENQIVREPDTKRQKTEKPQLYFKTLIDNTDSGPFKPKLKTKPFSITSLEESLELIKGVEGIPEHYPNPYEKEILTQEYNSGVFTKKEPIPSKDWNSTSAIYVNTEETLMQMVEALKKYSEIAVDLEHHDFRTYYGLTCLMQISTRDEDYIIDTLVLREQLIILNEVFCDPNITKVFHGAFMDIIWLQRDLGIYVVSLFDTYHASRALGFAKHSLAFLLENFAKFKTSKQYQLADWRQRPLPAPLLSYARSDTHFLLNIFDKLRNMLIDSKKIEHVLNESRNVAIRRFENNKYRPSKLSSDVYSVQEKSDPWVLLARNYNLPVYYESLIKELYDWRDAVAREEDESPRYIMSNQFLANLVITRPVDSSGILSTTGQLTPFISKNAHSLAQLIKNSLKAINQNSLINATINQNNDNSFIDSPSSISEELVINLKENFNKLVEFIGNNENQQISSEMPTSIKSLFSLPKEQWSQASNFISYDDQFGNSEETLATDLLERNKAVEKSFRSPLEVTANVIALLTELPDDSQNKEEYNKLSSNSKDDVPFNSVENDEYNNTDAPEGDTVVILNQKSVDQRKKALEEKLAEKERQAMNADIIPLDYDSGPKVLKNPDSKKSKKQNKKTFLKKAQNNSFNPYEENNALKGNNKFVLPKKSLQKKRTGNGKSITFKKK